MTLLGLLIPLVLFLSFIVKKKKIFIFSGIFCLVVLLFIFPVRKNYIDYTSYIAISLILFSLPIFVTQLENTSTMLYSEMNKRLSDVEGSLKDMETREWCLEDTIQALEKQNVAVSDLYEMTKEMSATLHFSEILKIFQDILCKIFPFEQGFLITLRHNPIELEIDKIYQVSRIPTQELKEVPLPHSSYYKTLEYLYHLKESRYIGKESNLCKQFNLQTSKDISISLLKAENRIIGAVILEGLTEEDFDRFCIFSTQFSLELKKVSLYEKIEELATTDSLTGLYLRRQFSKLAVEELNRAKRHNMNLAFLMLDIDYFKKCNDRYGHLIGDYVLKTIGRILKTNLREIDLVARYGGEEFSVILPDTGLEETKIVLERILQSVRNYDFKSYEQKFKITLSIGVAVFPQDGQTLLKLIESADKALYTAKNRGRNCVVFYGEISS